MQGLVGTTSRLLGLAGAVFALSLMAGCSDTAAKNAAAQADTASQSAQAAATSATASATAAEASTAKTEAAAADAKAAADRAEAIAAKTEAGGVHHWHHRVHHHVMHHVHHHKAAAAAAAPESPAAPAAPALRRLRLLQRRPRQRLPDRAFVLCLAIEGVRLAGYPLCFPAARAVLMEVSRARAQSLAVQLLDRRHDYFERLRPLGLSERVADASQRETMGDQLIRIQDPVLHEVQRLAGIVGSTRITGD